MLYSIREEGGLFGEHVLLDKPADVTATAFSRCDLFRVPRLEICELFDDHEAGKEEFGELVLETLLRHKQKRYFSLRISVNDAAHSLSEVPDLDRTQAICCSLSLHPTWIERNPSAAP